MPQRATATLQNERLTLGRVRAEMPGETVLELSGGGSGSRLLASVSSCIFARFLTRSKSRATMALTAGSIASIALPTSVIAAAPIGFFGLPLGM